MRCTNERTVAERPVVVEPMAHFLIDGAHRLHVGFAPLSAQILGLHLEQFQHVQLQQGVLDFQGPLQDRRRFENDQHLVGERQMRRDNEIKYKREPLVGCSIDVIGCVCVCGTMMRECFHLVSLFKMRKRLTQEKRLRQQYGRLEPISKLSAVSSGWSPITQDGKSKIAMLQQKFGIKNRIAYYKKD